MAKREKKRRVNKSQAIRDYIDKNPGQGPTAVSAALKKQGINVSPAFVSTIKSGDKKRGVVRPVGRPRLDASRPVSIEALMQAKKLADEMGGVEEAKRALDALARLVS